MHSGLFLTLRYALGNVAGHTRRNGVLAGATTRLLARDSSKSRGYKTARSDHCAALAFIRPRSGLFAMRPRVTYRVPSNEGPRVSRMLHDEALGQSLSLGCWTRLYWGATRDGQRWANNDHVDHNLGGFRRITSWSVDH